MIFNIDDVNLKTHDLIKENNFVMYCMVCGTRFFIKYNNIIETFAPNCNYSCNEFIIKNIIE